MGGSIPGCGAPPTRPRTVRVPRRPLQPGGSPGDVRREGRHLAVDAGVVGLRAALAPTDDADLEVGARVVLAEHGAAGVARAGVDAALGDEPGTDLVAGHEVAAVRLLTGGVVDEG